MGVANLRGKNLHERARALIAIAHPDADILLAGGMESMTNAP
ncbi:acetyl-CoA hydrolase/transferase C-terminal domain-containing protein [Sporomusa termitida]